MAVSTTPRRDALNWFEIPVRDMERAQKFYEAMLALKLRRESMGLVHTGGVRRR